METLAVALVPHVMPDNMGVVAVVETLAVALVPHMRKRQTLTPLRRRLPPILSRRLRLLYLLFVLICRGCIHQAQLWHIF